MVQREGSFGVLKDGVSGMGWCSEWGLEGGDVWLKYREGGDIECRNGGRLAECRSGGDVIGCRKGWSGGDVIGYERT